MSFYPYTITAIAKNTNEGSNVVAGGLVSLLDSYGQPVVMYDDAEGNNGSTGKQCDARGQVTVYIPIGEYALNVNGQANGSFVVTKPNKEVVTSYSTTAQIAALKPKAGDVVENQERANAKYIARDNYTAQAGDIAAANGRVWELQVGKYVDIKTMGGVKGQDVSQIISDLKALGKACVVDGAYLCSTVDILESEDLEIVAFLKTKECSLTLTDTTDYMFAFSNGNASLKIKGVALNGNRSGQASLATSDIIRATDKPSVNVTLEDCEISEVARFGIYIRATDVQGEGSKIDVKSSSFLGINEGDSGYDPSFIAALNKVNVSVKDSSFDLGYTPSGLGASACFTAASITPLTQSNTLVFIGNEVSRLGRRATNNLGAVEFYARTINSVIGNNRFFNCHQTPIRGKLGLDSLVISGNSIRDTQSGPDIAIFRDVLEPEVGGVAIDGNSIKGNVNTSSDASILVAGGVGELGATVSVAGNTILSVQGGVELQYIKDASVTGNTISGCASSQAISASNCEVVAIGSNSALGCSVEDSIRVNVCESASLTGNVVKNAYGVAFRAASVDLLSISGNTSTQTLTSTGNNVDFRISNNSSVVATGNSSDAATQIVQFGNAVYKEAANTWSA